MGVDISSFLATAAVAAVLGAIAMEVTLWVIGAAGWAHANMIVALGSLFTRAHDSGRRVGLVLHFVAATVFAMIYTFVMLKLGYTAMPASLFVGVSIGFLHGLIVSLGLVWVVAEQHPLAEFNEAGLAIGLAHIVGHVVYGAVVGLVVGISPI